MSGERDRRVARLRIENHVASLPAEAREKSRALARHAALPAVLDADLLHLLRVNFFLDPPDDLSYYAESELLLSPLCREVGDGLYVMEPAARELLLDELRQSRGGRTRLREVAALLWDYTERRDPWAVRPGLDRAQRLTAVGVLTPVRAREWLRKARAAGAASPVSESWFVAMEQALTVAAPPRPPEELERLHEALLDLDFHEQQEAFEQALRRSPRNAIIIQGDEGGGQDWLLYRLVGSLRSGRPVASFLINERSSSQDAPMEDPWRGLAHALRVDHGKDPIRAAREALAEIAREQDIVVALGAPLKGEPGSIQTVIEFWSALLSLRRSQGLRLLLFLLGDARVVEAFKEEAGMEGPWPPWTQTALPPIRPIPFQVLVDWVQSHPWLVDHDLGDSEGREEVFRSLAGVVAEAGKAGGPEGIFEAFCGVRDVNWKELLDRAQALAFPPPPDNDPDRLDDPEHWVLVVGRARLPLPEDLKAIAQGVGVALARDGYGLITGDCPGVDAEVTAAFVEALPARIALERRLLQIVRSGRKEVFTGAPREIVQDDQEYIAVSVERADAAVLIGGEGGTRKVGQEVWRHGKPILPLPSTGGTARELYAQIPGERPGEPIPGVSWEEFRRLEDVRSTRDAGTVIQLLNAALTPKIVRGPPNRVKILFMASNPADTTRLQIEEEYREIEGRIRASPRRNQFELAYAPEVRAQDLVPALLRHRPNVVQFSGHGTQDGGLLLSDERGRATPVSPSTMGRIFASTSQGTIRCVVLMSAYSEALARALVEFVDCVIGVSTAIADRTAIAFAAAFYEALAFGRSVGAAYQIACNMVTMGTPGAVQVPSLYVRPGVDSEEVHLL